MESATSCMGSWKAICFNSNDAGGKRPMLKSTGSNRSAISRRSLLRGAGVSLALPMLNAMAPLAAHAQAAAKPRRMFGICNNLGLLPGEFFPTDAGRDYTPSNYLKILQDYRKDFTVLSGVSHPNV